jgi:hypothetical protein
VHDYLLANDPFFKTSFIHFLQCVATQYSSLMCSHHIKSEGHYKPFFFNFVFILQAKNANVVANVGSLYFKACC